MFENLRARLAYNLLPKSVQAAAAKNIYNVFSRRSPGMPVYTDLSVEKATREGYKWSIYVYRAVRAIVQSTSGIPWIVVDNQTGETIPDHDFTRTWAKPNPNFAGQDNMELITAHLKLVGNAIIQPLMVNGRPKEFWICMPDLIRPIPSKTPGVWLDGYDVTDSFGKPHTLPPETFIHLQQFNPGDPYWGIGDLQAAARTVDCDNEAQDTQKVSMQNRGTPDGVFVNESINSKEQYDEAVRQVKEQYLPKDNKRAPWVIGGNTKWYQMSLTPVEMDYIQSRLRNLQDIATAFGIDPWWLGDRSHSTYNNVNEAKKALYETVSLPLLDDIKSTLNLKVAPLYPDGDRITITYDVSGVAALRDDFGQKVTQAKTLFDMGVSVQQANNILKLGVAEYPGWDIGYLPFSLAPASQVGDTEEEQPEPKKSIKTQTQTEEQKVAAWKRIDSRRLAWANVVKKKVAPLYEAEKKAIAAAIDGKDTGEMWANVSKAINKNQDDWLKTITAVDSIVIEDFGKEFYSQFKSKAVKVSAPPKPPPGMEDFDPFSDAVKRWLKEHVAESVTSILSTNLDDVKRIITQGITDGLSNKQVADQLTQYYDDNELFKAMRVARTESTAAAGYGQREAAKQLGFITTHTWLSSRDDRVRDSHADIDGETQPINEKYSNGLMYPGDTSGDPAEFIQCRCVEQFGWD